MHRSGDQAELYHLYVQSQRLKHILHDSSWKIIPNNTDNLIINVTQYLADIQENLEDYLFGFLERKGVFEELGDLGRPVSDVVEPVEQGPNVIEWPPTPQPHQHVPVDTLTHSSDDDIFYDAPLTCYIIEMNLNSDIIGEETQGVSW